MPMFLEADLAVETTRFWHDVARRRLVDQVLLVTTAKENVDGPSTHDLIAEELRRLFAGDHASPPIELVRCEHVTRYRASQLNLAVEQARARFAQHADGPAGLWVGVYNADSRPEASTFDELRARIHAEPDVRLFQQLVEYVVPGRGDAGLVAEGNAVLQTWWTLSHYVSRNARGRSGSTMWSRTAPYSTFGHGEFARLDFLDDIGGFPDFAYADGLLLGWICRLMAEPIGLLTSRDIAEVPGSAGDLLLQQTAWLRGLLNFDATVRWCRSRGLLRLSRHEAELLRAQHAAVPLGWGLSTLAVAASACVAVASLARRGRASQSAAYDLAVLAGLVSYPVIPALAWDHAHQQRPSSLSRRMLATATSWPIEGLAFWPALRTHLMRQQQAPAKTPR
ncbi:hypothetical protein ETD86_48930 [Nonomuraea turkmeniaca]|uniref:Glycosyltransferase n=1 Tax=Nonomuraea turkmeniaca TaxID=103838 RepID=A0A5S4EX16_9ACTN|nr:hypothetical protein ETD86_48930 [Nonomuraea turkmeniaca]